MYANKGERGCGDADGRVCEESHREEEESYAIGPGKARRMKGDQKEAREEDVDGTGDGTGNGTGDMMAKH